ncbi:MAG TPA: LysR substrate-binding domain-containing protein [Steroidobacteraceae bacterium]|jgi:DNA-binding transcriptional LysR family regulator
MKTLDLEAVQTFALISSLGNFTRVAEATGTTQAAVSLKLKRLESFLGHRLVERTPRSVRLTADGRAFLEHAKLLLAANQRALSAAAPARVRRLKVGISDHVMPAGLAIVLARLGAADAEVVLQVSVDFSQRLLAAFRKGQFDVVIVRQEHAGRGGELLDRDEYAWFAAPSLEWRAGERLPLASLAPPCGVRAIAIRALDGAGIAWREVFVGGGVASLRAAVDAGLAVAVLARHRAPTGCVDVGTRFKLPRLPRTQVVLHARSTGGREDAALRMLAAAFRGASASQGSSSAS